MFPSPAFDTWYNVWLVAHNANETYDIYLNDSPLASASVGDLVASGLDFRTGAAGVPGSLVNLAVVAVNQDSANTYFDDFFFDASGANLANPIPEPSTLGMIVSALMVLPILLRLRRR